MIKQNFLLSSAFACNSHVLNRQVVTLNFLNNLPSKIRIVPKIGNDSLGRWNPIFVVNDVTRCKRMT